MLLAMSPNGRIRARPNKIAICPQCKEQVISKCGQINIWHWSHKKETDCDNWSEGETFWHYKWKTIFGIEHCERTIDEHRADIIINNNIIELQASTISFQELAERNIYYYKVYDKKVIWIFRSDDFWSNFETCNRYEKDTFSFRWKHGRKSILYGIDLKYSRIFLHKENDNPNDSMFEIKKISEEEGRIFGLYQLTSIKDFKKEMLL